MELPRQYAYNPKWPVILGCALFFGACSAVAVYQLAGFLAKLTPEVVREPYGL